MDEGGDVRGSGFGAIVRDGVVQVRAARMTPEGSEERTDAFDFAPFGRVAAYVGLNALESAQFQKRGSHSGHKA